MELTAQQKEGVAAWFAAGASLDEIQKRIKTEFGVHMTYLDVRLLVAELPQPREADEGAAEKEGAKTPRTEPPDMGRDFIDGPDSRQDLEDGPGGHQESEAIGEAALPPLQQEDNPAADDNASTKAQTVSAPTVTIDALMIPGTLASGDVTFSDGQTGKWYLDQMGRLGLGGDLPQGYRPSPTDAALFQQQLMGLLQSKGLC